MEVNWSKIISIALSCFPKVEPQFPISTKEVWLGLVTLRFTEPPFTVNFNVTISRPLIIIIMIIIFYDIFNLFIFYIIFF